MPRPKQVKLTVAEVRAFLDAAAGDRHEALFTLMYQTGMREGELLGIPRAALDLAAARLVLDAPEKGGEPRTFRLPARSVRVLRTHLANKAEEQLASGGAYEETGLLFADAIGERLDPRRVRDAFHRVREAAKLRHFVPHDLRHACVTHLLEAGIPVKAVQEIVGHATATQTLDTYAYTTVAMEEAAVAAMDRVVGQ